MRYWGPWAFFECGIDDDRLSGLELPEPFDTPQACAEDAKRLDLLFNALLPELVEKLNDQHGVDYPSRYWRVLLALWLIDLLQFTWYRYREVEAFLARNKDRRFKAVIPPEDVTWQFPNQGSFSVETETNVALSAWVCGLVLRKIKPENLDLVVDGNFNSSQAQDQAYAPEPASLFRKGLRFLRGALKSKRFSVGNSGNEFSIWLKLKYIAFEAYFGCLLHFLKPKYDLKMDEPEVSKSDIEPSFPQPYLDLLDRFLWDLMPSCFGADFKRFDIIAKNKKYRAGKLRVLISSVMVDDDKKFEIAHAVRRKEVLVGCQHGSYYGLAGSLSYPFELEYRYPVFITWGWASHRGAPGNFLPLPSPQLAPFAKAHKEERGELLIVSNGVRYLTGRLNFIGDLFNRMTVRPLRLSLIDGLSEKVRSSTAYRAYPTVYGIMDDERFAKTHFGDIALVKDDFHNRMLRCRLLVSECPGTGFLQALVADVPSIGLWNEDAYYLCDEARPHMQALKKAGMIFDNGAEASETINRIWEDVPTWWNDPIKIEARRNFVNNYAMTDENWVSIWKKALKAL